MNSTALTTLIAAILILIWALRSRRTASQGHTNIIVADPKLLAHRRQYLREELVRLEAELDLQRGVFEVSSELVGCVEPDDLRTRLGSALSRYWTGGSLDLMVWERGAWRGLGSAAMGSPPDLDAPVQLPDEGGDLVLDLSPAVDGQAALVLRKARPQPSVIGLSSEHQRGVAELLRGQFALSLRRVMLFRSLQELARSDPLTGAYRRWYGESRLTELAEGGAVVSVCMVDIDHFKRVNDTYGHTGGDSVLAAVAKVLLAGVRHEDIVARVGGEEFLILLPGTPPVGALQVAERLRVNCAALTVVATPVTISIGVASCRRDESAAELMARADAAMYRAKSEGRNLVVQADHAGDLALVRTESVKRDPGSVTGLAKSIRAVSGTTPAPGA
ncbi:MAG: GGDEF domain-containing protein [Planctomycetota bacterium]